MKTIQSGLETAQWKKRLHVCVDVSKGGLWWRTEEGVEGHFAYKTQETLKWVEEQVAYGRAHGYSGVTIVCESTGHYHKRLLKLARKVGCETKLVSGEHVHRLQVVEDNTTGKADWKDPKTMLLLVGMERTFEDRQLGPEWLALRELNADLEKTEQGLTAVKNQIHAVYDQLFPDLSFGRDWRFEGEAARQVVSLYGMDPFAIVACGKRELEGKLRKKDIRQQTIDRLWTDANQAILVPSKPLWREIKVEQLKDRYEELAVLQKRRSRIREKMVMILGVLQEKGEVKLRAVPGLIGPVMLARLFAETGPMSEFASAQHLLKYGGMNLRPKQSGTMKGRDRQSKRGRSRLRLVLGQAVLKLVVKGGLFGPYFHARRAEGVPGPVAMTAVARKFLKLLFSLEKTGEAYDPTRVFACESVHAKAA